jgi:hypothetical protein
MINALLVGAGIAVVVWTLGLLDWWAHRREQKSQHGRA